eukprot:4490481-Alexandrium_andersonii.AAC.1
MGPHGDRRCGPGEPLSHSQKVEETLRLELEGFRHSWWAEFSKYVAEKVEDGYDDVKWTGDIRWCGKERLEKRLNYFYRTH